MDEQEEQRIRLERKLKFLKGSLDADIISREEYEKGKERIEKKLKELGGEEKPKIEIKEEVKKEEPGVEKKPEAEEKEAVEKKPRLTVVKYKEKPKLLWWAVLAIAIILVSVYMCSKAPAPYEETAEEEIKLPVCSSDDECEQEGMIGVCENPGMEDAECSFIEPVEVGLIVLNDETCVSCDTRPTIKIIKSLFPGVEYREIDFNSEEGKEIAEEFDVEVLPAYILDSNLEDAYNYEKAKRAFASKGDKHIMSAYSSGANYYFKRSRVNNTLELFALSGSINTIKAEKNIEEVLELFGDKIVFEEHLMEAGETVEGIGINTYPAFLVNNQYKFSGVHAAETIKEEFCAWNPLEECIEELSIDLK